MKERGALLLSYGVVFYFNSRFARSTVFGFILPVCVCISFPVLMTADLQEMNDRVRRSSVGLAWLLD